MKIIRETDPEYWDKLEAEGDMPELDITSELPSCCPTLERATCSRLLICQGLVHCRVSTDGAWQSGRCDHNGQGKV